MTVDNNDIMDKNSVTIQVTTRKDKTTDYKKIIPVNMTFYQVEKKF